MLGTNKVVLNSKEMRQAMQEYFDNRFVKSPGIVSQIKEINYTFEITIDERQEEKVQLQKDFGK